MFYCVFTLNVNGSDIMQDGIVYAQLLSSTTVKQHLTSVCSKIGMMVH